MSATTDPSTDAPRAFVKDLARAWAGLEAVAGHAVRAVEDQLDHFEQGASAFEAHANELIDEFAAELAKQRAKQVKRAKKAARAHD